jgi:hypothetical protein
MVSIKNTRDQLSNIFWEKPLSYPTHFAVTATLEPQQKTHRAKPGGFQLNVRG